jgi:hypothetical protein
MTVHNHAFGPSCRERKVGECLLPKDAVVLDLRTANPHVSREDVLSHLIETLRGAVWLSCNRLAGQIEAQTKPTRIPEPGKYGVVRDKHGVEWVTYGQHRWVQLDQGLRDWPWVDIEDPTLVREGL